MSDLQTLRSVFVVLIICIILTGQYSICSQADVRFISRASLPCCALSVQMQRIPWCQGPRSTQHTLILTSCCSNPTVPALRQQPGIVLTNNAHVARSSAGLIPASVQDVCLKSRHHTTRLSSTTCADTWLMPSTRPRSQGPRTVASSLCHICGSHDACPGLLSTRPSWRGRTACAPGPAAASAPPPPERLSARAARGRPWTAAPAGPG